MSGPLHPPFGALDPDALTRPAPRRLRRCLTAAVRLFSSYGLSVTLLLLLFVLTGLGTWAQRTESLHDVQTRYFESVIVWDRALGFPLPLPGAYLLLGLLGVNLITGGIVRIRKTRSTLGVLIVHLGILGLLASGAVELYGSTKGHLTLFEGQRSAEFESAVEWELAIGVVGGREEWAIPASAFRGCTEDRRKTFISDRLPFRISVGAWARNADLVSSRSRTTTDALPVLNHVFARPLAPEKQVERNQAAVYLTLTEQRSGLEQRAVLWGRDRDPQVVETSAERYTLRLRRRRFPLPFAVTLDDFRRELHPRAGGMPKAFESDVQCAVGETIERRTIRMNDPLRRDGFTLFQSGWGPQNAPAGTPLFSTFSVVRNPADRWPLIACIVIALGLTLHFVQKLVRSQRRVRS